MVGPRPRGLLEPGLPSTHYRGRPTPTLPDPAERPCPDGTVCLVIGDVTTQNAGFATLRCTDGLVVVLKVHREHSGPALALYHSGPALALYRES
jgi:hypothetical protein